MHRNRPIFWLRFVHQENEGEHDQEHQSEDHEDGVVGNHGGLALHQAKHRGAGLHCGLCGIGTMGHESLTQGCELVSRGGVVGSDVAAEN